MAARWSVGLTLLLLFIVYAITLAAGLAVAGLRTVIAIPAAPSRGPVTRWHPAGLPRVPIPGRCVSGARTRLPARRAGAWAQSLVIERDVASGRGWRDACTLPASRC